MTRMTTLEFAEYNRNRLVVPVEPKNEYVLVSHKIIEKYIDNNSIDEDTIDAIIFETEQMIEDEKLKNDRVMTICVQFFTRLPTLEGFTAFNITDKIMERLGVDEWEQFISHPCMPDDSIYYSEKEGLHTQFYRVASEHVERIREEINKMSNPNYEIYVYSVDCASKYYD